MSLDLIETLKTPIYNPKHTKDTKIHFNFFKMFKISKIHIFKKRKSALYADVYGIIYIVEGHTA